MTDDGFAPNTSGGVCTLAICKPKIRLSAKVGDVVIGLRGRTGEIGKRGPNAVDSVLYVMRVTKKMTLAEYDTWCLEHCPSKIPSLDNLEGDCQYTKDLEQRPYGPHQEHHKMTDLSGKYVLLAEGRENFWYRKEAAGHRLTPELSADMNVESVRRGHCVRPLADFWPRLEAWLATFPCVYRD